MIQTERYKYICYLIYTKNEKGVLKPIEQLFDKQADPDQVFNLINESSVQLVFEQCRAYWDFILDSTPAKQLQWAPFLAATKHFKNEGLDEQ